MRYLFSFLGILILNLSAHAQTDYVWNPVTIGGGGYVTGLLMHPTEPDLRYTRTDVGGAYRWDPTDSVWVQMLNWLDRTQSGFSSVDGIAVTAADPDIIYAAVGDDAVIKSVDQGRNWTVTNFAVAGEAFSGNQRDVRYAGERIAIDPFNKNIVYVGTKNQGLYKTTDGGTSWNHITGLPINTATFGRDHRNIDIGTVGIRTIICDPYTQIGGISQHVYVGVYGTGVYLSTDGGTTFAIMEASPKYPRRMAVSTNGSLWVTSGVSNPDLQGSNGLLHQFKDGRWVNKTPTTSVPDQGEPMGAITVHPENPNIIVTARQRNLSNQPIWLSEDEGQTWKEIHKGPRTLVPWWPSYFFGTGPSAIVIDPHYPDSLWMTDGAGVHLAQNYFADPVVWDVRVKGIEELVMFALKSPNIGSEARLFSGAADAGGFRHVDFSEYPEPINFNPRLSELTGIDYANKNPFHIATVGAKGWDSPGYGGYSLDNGKTWLPFENYIPHRTQSGEFAAGGKIAVSATGIDTMVVTPIGEVPHYTHDRGKTWTKIEGINATFSVQTWQAVEVHLASDELDGKIFYLMGRDNGFFYRSEDGGATFQKVNDLPNGNWGNWIFVRPVPGQTKHLWASTWTGLHYSFNGGDDFTSLEEVSLVETFAFGKNAPGSEHPTLYVIGTVKDIYGIHRSHDLGATWEQINGSDFRLGIGPRVIEADKVQYGQIYIAVGGRGIVYGRDTTAAIPASSPPSVNLSYSESAGTYSFSAQGSESTSGAPLITFYWSFGDGNTAIGEEVNHTFQTAGTYQVSLSVVDELGNVAQKTTTLVLPNASIGRYIGPPLAMDGQLDSLWLAVPGNHLKNKLFGNTSAAGDLDVTWKALWDETNLYVFVDVIDEAIYGDSEATYHEDDAVELYFDWNNSKTANYDGVDDYQYIFRAKDEAGKVFNLPPNGVENVSFKTIDRVGGYRMELLFPFAAYGISPEEGLEIGFEVHVNDDDTGNSRDAKHGWNSESDNAWSRTDVFGTVRLGDTISIAEMQSPSLQLSENKSFEEGDDINLTISGQQQFSKVRLYDQQTVIREEEGAFPGDYIVSDLSPGSYSLSAELITETNQSIMASGTVTVEVVALIEPLIEIAEEGEEYKVGDELRLKAYLPSAGTDYEHIEWYMNDTLMGESVLSALPVYGQFVLDKTGVQIFHAVLRTASGKQRVTNYVEISVRESVVLSTSDYSADRQIRVFPNPAAGEITIENHGKAGEYEIIVYAISGKVIFRQNFSNSKSLKVNLGSTPGIFMLTIQGKNGLQMFRILNHKP